MKKINYLPVCVALLTAGLGFASNAAQSNEFSYSYIEVSGVQAKIDKLEGEELSGYSVTSSVALGENAYFRMKYTDADDNINIQGVNQNVDMQDYLIGFGIHYKLSDNSDWFAELAQERNDGEFYCEDGDGDDNLFGYSAAAGVRSMPFANVELAARVKYFHNGDENEISAQVGAYYELINNLAIGVDYKLGENTDILAANLRYTF
ncbi:hypothetical protein [Thalassotalea atypica]|uniref:hypothetical protein n=1 Tax=Thalassotalea atypica TaxID=2054316 RepID=UPI00257280B7|nr:hypothetical protein [Thalassotalea atypica]